MSAAAELLREPWPPSAAVKPDPLWHTYCGRPEVEAEVLVVTQAGQGMPKALMAASLAWSNRLGTLKPPARASPHCSFSF